MDAIKVGCPVKVTCRAAGIGLTTFKSWMNQNSPGSSCPLPGRRIDRKTNSFHLRVFGSKGGGDENRDDGEDGGIEHEHAFGAAALVVFGDELGRQLLVGVGRAVAKPA